MKQTELKKNDICPCQFGNVISETKENAGEVLQNIKNEKSADIKKYSDCCEPLHLGQRKAQSALELMKSRYCAFIAKQFDYLRKTTHPQSLGNINHAENEKWANNVQFTKLEILFFEEQGNKGTVEFKAHFTFTNPSDGVEKSEVHHERSTFRKQQGEWFFKG